MMNFTSTVSRTSSRVGFVRFVIYWFWSGILEAAKIGRRIKDPNYTQFHISLLTMMLGVALVCPGEMWTPLSSFLQLWMPETVWGIIFMATGRFGLHAMLSGGCRVKCVGASCLTGCWAFLTWVTLFSSGLSIGALVFLYIAWRAGELAYLMCRRKC